MLHEELKIPVKLPKNVSFLFASEEDIAKKFKEYMQYLDTYENSPIMNHFRGIYIITHICQNCKRITLVCIMKFR